MPPLGLLMTFTHDVQFLHAINHNYFILEMLKIKHEALHNISHPVADGTFEFSRTNCYIDMTNAEIAEQSSV